jgi:hypothetical protein
MTERVSVEAIFLGTEPSRPQLDLAELKQIFEENLNNPSSWEERRCIEMKTIEEMIKKNAMKKNKQIANYIGYLERVYYNNRWKNESAKEKIYARVARMSAKEREVMLQKAMNRKTKY